MAARDDDKAIDGLLRRSLARDPGSTGECPDADILAAYFECSLDADEVASYEQHIARCSQCREHLAAILRAEGAAGVPEQRELVAAAALAPRPKELRSETTRVPEKHKYPGVFDWRWLAPAAAVLIFAVFVYVRVTSRDANSVPSKNAVVVLRSKGASSPELSQDLSDRESRPQASPESQLKQAAPAKRKTELMPAQPREYRAQTPPQAKSGQHTASTDSGARAASPSARSSQSAGGVMARGRAGVAGAVAQKEAAVDAGAPTSAQKNNSGPSAVPVSGGGGEGTAAPSPAPPPADAKKEAKPTDSSAPPAQTTATNKTSKPPEAPASSINDSIGIISRSVQMASPEAPASRSPEVIVFRVTSDGLVERSNDGGATWQPEHLKTKVPIVAASAPSGKICWLVGRDGIILLTNNGKSWKKISPPLTIDLVGVMARDARSATVTAVDERKFSTEDGGKTWQQLK